MQFEGAIGKITPRSVYTRNAAGREDFLAANPHIIDIICMINAPARFAVQRGLSLSFLLEPIGDAGGQTAPRGGPF
jgi:hypothetical protein